MVDVQAGTFSHTTQSDFSKGKFENVVVKDDQLWLVGNGWVKQPTMSVEPAWRWGHAMAYDSQNDVVVLFGGNDYDKEYADTWLYDVAANRWTQRFPAEHPSPRYGHAMVYDSVNHQMVLYGGYTDNGYNGETWTYAVATNTWMYKNPTSPPGGRYDHAMAYDPQQQRVVLQGGATSSGATTSTYTYDPAANTWKYENNLGPEAANHAMAYDPTHDTFVIFSEATYTATGPDYDWQIQTVMTEPCERSGHVMTYDAGVDSVILFGGGDSSDDFNDIWFYKSQTNIWTFRDHEEPAAPKEGAFDGFVYDHDNGVNVLRDEDDTWLYYSQYKSSGWYESATFDAGDYAGTKWQELHWSPGAQLTGTMLKFQVASNNDGVTWTYLGPDGTAGTYYTTPGTAIWSGHSDHRYLRYKAVFSTTDSTISPVLDKVLIEYERPPTEPFVHLTSPNGGEDWLKDESYPIVWELRYGELAETPVTLEYSTDSGDTWTTIATDLENTGYYTWTVPNTGNTPSAMIRITVTDVLGNTYSDTSDTTFAIDPPPGSGVVPGESEVDDTPETSNEQTRDHQAAGDRDSIGTALDPGQFILMLVIIAFVAVVSIQFIIIKRLKK